jgi:hypothetical protein
MDTERNRARVLAQALRAATTDCRDNLLGIEMEMGRAILVGTAIASIEAVADELYAIVAGRDLPASEQPS